MKQFVQKVLALSASKGFTLIELLTVIGILGILTAGVLFTIDPVEQIKQANDVKAMNYVVQFGKSIHGVGASMDQYYHSDTTSGYNAPCYYHYAAKYLKDKGIMPSAVDYGSSCSTGSKIGSYTYRYAAFNDNNSWCTSAGGLCSQFIILVNLTSKKYSGYSHYSYDSVNGRGCFRTSATPWVNGADPSLRAAIDVCTDTP